MTSSSHEPTRTRAPSETGLLVETGISPASTWLATVSAPVDSTTGARACQWSGCRWVVTTRANPASPTSSSSVSGSAGRVDQRLLAGDRAPEKIGVVGHLADGDLRDDEVAGFTGVGRSTDLDLS